MQGPGRQGFLATYARGVTPPVTGLEHPEPNRWRKGWVLATGDQKDRFNPSDYTLQFEDHFMHRGSPIKRALCVFGFGLDRGLSL